MKLYPRPQDVLEKLAALGTIDAELVLASPEVWQFKVARNTVAIHWKHPVDTDKPKVLLVVAVPSCATISKAIAWTEPNALVAEIANNIFKLCRNQEERSLSVRDVMGGKLYRARHVLGNRHPLAVLAVSEVDAQTLCATHWKVVPNNVAIEEPTDDSEAGRHTQVLTRKGMKPAEVVFRTLAELR